MWSRHYHLFLAHTTFHFHNQIKRDNVCRLFEGFDGYKDGEQKRDFVYVEDCVNVNLVKSVSLFPKSFINLGAT